MGSKGDLYNYVVEENFGTLFRTVLTLLQGFTLDSAGSIYRPLVLEAPLLSFYFLAFILLVSIALMNLVTALMLESAMDSSKEDRDVIQKMKKAEKLGKIQELRGIFQTMDADKSNM